VVENHLIESGRLIRHRMPVALSVLYTLWTLANPDPFRTSGWAMSKSKQSIHRNYIIIIECLRELTPRYIRWPDARERDTIKFEMERRYGYPSVVGAIDGTNIPITAPAEQKRR